MRSSGAQVPSFVRHFGRKRRGGAGFNRTSSPAPAVPPPPAPAVPPPPAPAVPPPSDDPWQAVTDKQTGQTYWWNPQTDETTAVGAPKPQPGQAAVLVQQRQPQQQGLGSILMEGMAFGVGSSMAHRLVDSVMGPREVHVNDAGGDAAPTESEGGDPSYHDHNDSPDDFYSGDFADDGDMGGDDFDW
eukprot:CAMPEP_0175141326 /NCGR_PEP_ID=MMETSP0087-20121206/12047_1 /TAXON_ID=136419 /ORGANISM="Unknown Unknown, Strain D1" /LENGTH=186 /DNA_ID=CAMNT_0016424737 /DNA_START=34 /DNA_END=594 /DNA_ORIENTATION=-